MARERYLINAGEDTIHSQPIVPRTAKEKRENFWYHYKWHTIAIVAAVIFVGSFVYSIISKVEPDYTVALLTSYMMPANGIEELERCITPYADDRNGDGKVTVNVVNYSLTTDSASDYEAMQAQQAAITRLVADITVNESMIFLHDESSFEYMQNDFDAFFLYNDGTSMPEGATDFKNAMLSWEEVPALADFVPQADEGETFTGEVLDQLFGQLRVSFRTSKDTSMEKKEKYMNYYTDSMNLFDRLKNNTPYSKGDE